MTKLEWNAHERKEQAHSPDWYWAAAIIAVAIIVASVILHNLLFAVFILISTLVLFLHTSQKPRPVRFELTNKGLHIGKQFTPFTTLESFCVEETGEPKLLLKSKNMLSPLLIIPLESMNSDTVREYVAAYLYEEELHEPFSRKVMEFFGF
ncbi:MAG: hypothetical protein Q7R88_01625 [bacterium]|nr:hypothetical protein [bacterium]